MSNLIPFQFERTSIRVITDETGEPLFVGKDICEAVGYKDHNAAMRDHCKGGCGNHTPLRLPVGCRNCGSSPNLT